MKGIVTLADDNQDRGAKLQSANLKARHAVRNNSMLAATSGKATRTAPDKVVFNDLCQILRPDPQRENSNKLLCTDHK